MIAKGEGEGGVSLLLKLCCSRASAPSRFLPSCGLFPLCSDRFRLCQQFLLMLVIQIPLHIVEGAGDVFRPTGRDRVDRDGLAWRKLATKLLHHELECSCVRCKRERSRCKSEPLVQTSLCSACLRSVSLTNDVASPARIGRESLTQIVLGNHLFEQIFLVL